MLLMRSQWDAGLNEMTINHGPTINKNVLAGPNCYLPNICMHNLVMLKYLEVWQV
jgi:hypothetical protein